MGLDEIRLLKQYGSPGAVITLDPALTTSSPNDPVLSAGAELILTEGTRGLPVWERLVADSSTMTVDSPVWVEVELRNGLWLVGRMKPILDGLTPLLGRDPGGTSAFYPNDDLVEEFVLRRVAGQGPAIELRCRAS